MKKGFLKLKKIISAYPVLLNLLRILKDKRYFYHILQGRFTSTESRKALKEIEKFFYKDRISLKDQFSKEIKNDEARLSFREEGLLVNPIKIKKEIIENIKMSLLESQCHDPENAQEGYFLISDRPKNIKRAYYKCEDLALIPEVMDIANNPLILAFVSNYFGALPRIDSIYAWWSFPSESPALTQSFHRDIDTIHALKFFIYLTDVDSDAGPHIYVKSSMNSNITTSKDKSHSDNDIESKYHSKNIINITGSAGHNFLADTFSFHKGLTPTTKPRLLLQIYYSLKMTPFGPKKPFIKSDSLQHLDKDRTTQMVNENIVSY